MDQLIRIHRKLDLNGILSHTHTHTLSLDEERLNFPFKEQGLGIQSRQNTSVIYLSMPPIIYLSKYVCQSVMQHTSQFVDGQT